MAARWITVRKPFDFYWSHRSVTHFGEAELGDQFVKEEIADFAVAKGYATEGKLDDASRSTKGAKKRAGRTRKAAKAPDSSTGATVGDADAADADRPADRPAVDTDAE